MLKDRRDLFEVELKWERVHDIKGKKFAYKLSKLVMRLFSHFFNALQI